MKTHTILLRYLALAGLAIVLAACASTPTQPLDSYAHQSTRGDIDLYWSCAWSEPRVLQVKGVAVSQFYTSPVQDLEFRLTGLNAQGVTVSRVSRAANEYEIPMMAQSPFQLTLRTTGTEAGFDLAYNYFIQESGGGKGEGGYSGEKSNVAKNVCPVVKP